jgi:hypothetical protein
VRASARHNTNGFSSSSIESLVGASVSFTLQTLSGHKSSYVNKGGTTAPRPLILGEFFYFDSLVS